VTTPAVTFYRLYPAANDPRRAPRDAHGTLPHRAVQYCDAVTAACSYGWWVFSPLDALLMWDGHTIYWGNGEGWEPVEDTACFPGWPDGFDAPDHAKIVPPAPFLTALPEPGTVQVTLGFAAKAAPGWGLHVRAPANWASGNIQHFEGIIDPSLWFGSLFINLRLTRTDTPIRLYSDRPLAQVQPVQLAHLTSDAPVLAMGEEEWQLYADSFVEPATRPDRRAGGYAVASRRERKARGCPV
jgi:hypothetical protein